MASEKKRHHEWWDRALPWAFASMVLAGAISFAVLFVLVSRAQTGVEQQARDARVIARQNAKTVEYLCDLADSLANVLDSASKQIQAQLDSGFYDRPEVVALVGSQAKQNAQDTASAYEQHVQKLRRAGNPCNALQSHKPVP